MVCGTEAPQTADLVLEIDGVEHKTHSVGDGPVDAAFKAVRELVPNDARLVLLRDLAQDSRPDAVIELIWQACLTYDVESHRVKRLVETELDRPYLRIETDYSPSDSARIALRVEALFETVRARQNHAP